MRYLKRIFRGLLWLVALVLALPVVMLAAWQVPAGQSLVSSMISSLASTAAQRVDLEGFKVSPALGTISFEDLRLSDADGTWLEIETGSLRWSPARLITGQVDVNALSAARVALTRLPAAPAGQSKDGGPASGQIPGLPFGLGFSVEAIDLAVIDIGAGVAGTPVSLSLGGNVSLDPEPLTIAGRVDLQRIDGVDGRLKASARFAPADRVLAFTLDVSEPAGGLAAHLLEIDGLPGLDITLSGEGPLDAWAAELRVAIDGRETVTGTANLTSFSGMRLLDVDLDGALSPLAPPMAAAFLLGTTELRGSARLTEEFKPLSADVEIATQTVRLTASAQLDPATEAIDAKTDVSVSAGDGRLIALDLPAQRIAFGDVTLSGSVSGRVDDADWSVALTANSLTSAHASFASARLNARGTGADLSPGAMGSPFKVSGQIDGFDSGRSGLAPFKGPVRLDAEGTAQLGPLQIALSQLELSTAAARMALSSARYSAENAAATGTFAVPDLRLFSDLADRPLAGAVSGSFTSKGNPAARSGQASVTLTSDTLETGTKPLDALIGGNTSLSARFSAEGPGRYQITDLDLTGAGITATGKMGLEETALSGGLTATLSDLTLIDPQVSGAAAIDLSVSGTIAAPSVTATATSDTLALAGTPLDRLQVTASAELSRTKPKGSFLASATLGQLPLKVEADLTSADGTARIAPLTASLGSNAADGTFSIADITRPLESLTGSLSLNAPDLSELSPLLLTEIAGQMSGNLTAAARNGGTALTLTASGRDLSGPGAELTTLDINADVPVPFVPRQLSAGITATGLIAGGTPVHKIVLSAKPGQGATALSGDIRLYQDGGDGLSFEGALTPVDGGVALALSALNGRYQTLRTRLDAPARIAYADGQARIDDLSLALGSGRLRVEGSAGDHLDLSARLDQIPLALANAVQPGLGLSGTLSGTITAKGPANAPAATWSLTGSELSAAPLRDNGLAALALASKGSFNDGRVTQNTQISGADGLLLTADGSATMGAGTALDLTVGGTVPLSALRRPLTQAGLRASGSLSIDGSVGGTASAPQYRISARPSGVSVTGLSTGMSIQDVAGAVLITQEEIALQTLTAALATGGSLTASGTVGLADGMPANVTATIDQGRYIEAGLVSATVDANVTVSGPLASPSNAALISGAVTIEKADIAIPETLPGAVPPVAVQHVNAPKAVRDQAAELGGHTASADNRETRNQPPRLDISLSAPGRIFVRGRGLDAELEGNLQIVGTTQDPQAIGAFTLRRGQFNILARRLDFSSGSATFSGSLTPVIDFAATTVVDGTQITVTVTGEADDPVIGFTSSPELPQDEVLALLLFGKEMGNLSPTQIAQLAAALATLTGGSDQGPLASLRRSLGLDVVDINTEGENGPSVAVGRYINENIYLGVEQGTGNASSRVQVDIDLDRGLKLRGEVGADGSSKAGVFFEREY